MNEPSTEEVKGRASPRRKLPGGVIHVGAGVYAAQYFCRGCDKHRADAPPLQRRHRERAGSRSLARDLVTKRRNEIREGRFFSKPAPAWNPVFAALKKDEQGREVVTGYVADYIARNRSTFVNPDGPERYARYFAHAPETKGKTMRNVHRADAERYRERRRSSFAPGAQRKRAGVSVTTVNKELSFARSVYYDFIATLEDRGEPPIPNPFAARRRDKRRLYEPEPPGRTRHLGSHDDDEARRLFDALPDFDARARVSALLLCGVDRGCVFAWEWRRDIDRKRGRVRGWRRKGQGEPIEYWASMNPDLRRLFDAIDAQQVARWGKRSTWVFPNATNTGPDDGREFFWRVFRPARERAGMPDFRLKDCRHSYATWLGEKGGADLVLIGKELGHRPGSRCTAIYRHATDREARAAAEKLTGLLPLDVVATPVATLTEHAERKVFN